MDKTKRVLVLREYFSRSWMVILPPFLVFLLFCVGALLWVVLAKPSDVHITPSPIADLPTPTSTRTSTSTPTPSPSKSATPTEPPVTPTPSSTTTPTPSPTPITRTPTHTSTPSPTLTNTLSSSLSPTVTNTSTAIPAPPPIVATPTETGTPTPTATPTSFSLLPAVVIDDRGSEQDQDKLNFEKKDSFKWLRWKLWPENNESGTPLTLPLNFPNNWKYMVRILSRSDVNEVVATVVVTQEELKQGKNNELYPNHKVVENEGWYTYSFDLAWLPVASTGCYPYWDVIIVVEDELVTCPPDLKDDRQKNSLCQMTFFPKQQVNLADKHPAVDCTGISKGSDDTRTGTSNPPEGSVGPGY